MYKIGKAITVFPMFDDLTACDGLLEKTITSITWLSGEFMKKKFRHEIAK